MCFGLASSWGGLGSVTVSMGWGGTGLASAGAEVVSVEALGWQPVKEKTVRAALNAVKVGRSLFTAADLTVSFVTGKAGK